MGSLYFPQLSTGALAQFPIRKGIQLRTIRNVMRDGSLVSFPDSGVSIREWSLSYQDLSASEIAALKAFFDACVGPLLPFTFLDPTGNLLAWSLDLTNNVWERSSLIKVSQDSPDPCGGLTGFTIVNEGQAFEEIFQAVPVPGNFQYCFSMYATSPQTIAAILFRRGANAEEEAILAIGSSWTRIQTAGRLNDGGNTFSVGLRLAPGQSVTIFGLQLETQVCCSSYKPTANGGSIYPNCFWGTQELAITADAPDSYSTLISLQTKI